MNKKTRNCAQLKFYTQDKHLWTYNQKTPSRTLRIRRYFCCITPLLTEVWTQEPVKQNSVVLLHFPDDKLQTLQWYEPKINLRRWYYANVRLRSESEDKYIFNLKSLKNQLIPPVFHSSWIFSTLWICNCRKLGIIRFTYSHHTTQICIYSQNKSTRLWMWNIWCQYFVCLVYFLQTQLSPSWKSTEVWYSAS